MCYRCERSRVDKMTAHYFGLDYLGAEGEFHCTKCKYNSLCKDHVTDHYDRAHSYEAVVRRRLRKTASATQAIVSLEKKVEKLERLFECPEGVFYMPRHYREFLGIDLKLNEMKRLFIGLPPRKERGDKKERKKKIVKKLTINVNGKRMSIYAASNQARFWGVSMYEYYKNYQRLTHDEGKSNGDISQ